MQKNIIVFGATGFFGGSFVRSLVGKNVTLVTREYVSDNLGFNNLLYTDLENSVIEESFHLAFDFSSRVSVEEFLMDPQKEFLNNIEITIKNIRFLSKLGFNGRYVYISTDRALADADDVDYVNQINVRNDPYGASKLIGELIVKYACSLDWDSATVIRFPNLYGSGQKSKQLIPTILDELKKGQLKIELGTLVGSRNYLHISDAVDALIKFVDDPGIEQDLCISGVNVTIETILKCFTECIKTRYDKEVTFIPRNKVSSRSSFKTPPEILDDLVFRRKYNWEPKVTIENGINLLLEMEKI
jgi:nucleoside-diphosphate-sugar epimerase